MKRTNWRGLTSASLLLALSASAALAQDAGAPPATPPGPSAPAPADAKEAPAEEAEPVKKDPEVERLAAEKKKLADEKQALLDEIKEIRETHKAEIERMQAEVKRLSAEAALRSARIKASMAAQSEELERLRAESSLRQARDQHQNSEVQRKLMALKNKQALSKLEEMDSLSGLQSESSRIQAKLSLARAKRSAELEAMKAEQEKIAAETALISARMRLDELKRKAQLAEAAKITDELSLRATKDKLKEVVTGEVSYPDKPYSHGRLVISDRRIPLNGPIITGTADYICERIHFFNNQNSTAPIFLVIDRCPGGSVMEGYRIVKAMEASRAPIHVVVRSFAASMAAVITTLADHSYAYPNALILHHQMSTGAMGNMTQIKEQYEQAKQWEARLMDPVCKKIGSTRDEFIKQMYANSSDGDWAEFADRAQKMRWVNEIVQEIREEGIVKRPEGAPPRPFYFIFMSDERKDDAGRPYRTLPRLGPFDFYMMHNPDRYWRMR